MTPPLTHKCNKATISIQTTNSKDNLSELSTSFGVVVVVPYFPHCCIVIWNIPSTLILNGGIIWVTFALICLCPFHHRVELSDLGHLKDPFNVFVAHNEDSLESRKVS